MNPEMEIPSFIAELLMSSITEKFLIKHSTLSEICHANTIKSLETRGEVNELCKRNQIFTS